MDLPGKIRKIFSLACWVVGIIILVFPIVSSSDFLKEKIPGLEFALLFIFMSVVVQLIDKLYNTINHMSKRIDQKPLDGSLYQFNNVEDFYEDLAQEVNSPQLTAAHLTAVRHEPWQVNKGKSYYDKIFSICKERKIAMKRIIGVPNEQMKEFALKNLQMSETIDDFEVHVMAWLPKYTGFNFAVLFKNNHPDTVYLVLTKGEGKVDSRGFKLAGNQDVASYFESLFENLYTVHSKKPDEITLNTIMSLVHDVNDLRKQKGITWT